MTQREMYQALINQLSKQYFVGDVVPSPVQFIFLLESPHSQELKYGAPVCGPSGSSMTKHLFGDTYGNLPLGRLLLAHEAGEIQSHVLGHVGLMNSCNIPLQGSAYTSQAQRQAESLFEIFAGIRTANQRDSFSNQQWNVVQSIIVSNLRQRLQKLQGNRLVFVPCGRFAQKFFRLAAVSGDSWTVIPGVPHPSYNGFAQPRYHDAVCHMKDVFESVVL